MVKRLNEHPRVAIIKALNHDDEIAWLRPHALVGDYAQPLADEVCSEFGVEFAALLAHKGLDKALSVGDAFKTYNPNLPMEGQVIVGEYLPSVEPL